MPQDLEEHFKQVQLHLASQLSYGELELALADLRDLQQRASECSMTCALLESLDVAMARDVQELDLQLDSEEDLADRAEVLACAGDYCALFRHFAFGTALHQEATQQTCLARPRWGLARCLAEQLTVTEEDVSGRRAALDVALDVVLHLPPVHRDPLAERQCCQALFLLENLASSSPVGTLEDALAASNETTLEFLNFLQPFIPVAAAAVEALARRCLAPAPWLGMQRFGLEHLKQSHGLRALLMDSQAFCHRRCEALVQDWRRDCARQLKALPEDAQGDDDLISSAAALACHCYFVGYCIPLAEGEDSEHLELPEASKSTVHLLAQWMYQAPLASQLQQAAEKNEALATLLRRCCRNPMEESEIVKTLERFPDVKTAFTPCEDFYDTTAYPPWHKGIECMGVLPMPLRQHLQHLCPQWHPPDSEMVPPRILVAGCGSGHQVAVELRSYDASTELVAFDVSAKTVATAQRKLKETLAPEEFARVRFLVGDIHELSPGHPAFAPGFDLVVCCGVLHHLPDPVVGLQRLASVLKPKVGVLQLATYSTLSHRTWQSSKDWLHEQQFFPAPKGEACRPTQAEVREIRSKVLAAAEEQLDTALTLLHFSEFYSYAGLLDLLFHPLERTFTLIELLENVIPPSGLVPLGVFFLDVID